MSKVFGWIGITKYAVEIDLIHSDLLDSNQQVRGMCTWSTWDVHCDWLVNTIEYVDLFILHNWTLFLDLILFWWLSRKCYCFVKGQIKFKLCMSPVMGCSIKSLLILQFVKSFTIYYIKYVCLRIWVSKLYIQELRWESMEKSFNKKNLIMKSFLATQIEKKNTFWDISD